MHPPFLRPAGFSVSASAASPPPPCPAQAGHGIYFQVTGEASVSLGLLRCLLACLLPTTLGRPPRRQSHPVLHLLSANWLKGLGKKGCDSERRSRLSRATSLRHLPISTTVRKPGRPSPPAPLLQSPLGSPREAHRGTLRFRVGGLCGPLRNKTHGQTGVSCFTFPGRIFTNEIVSALELIICY